MFNFIYFDFVLDYFIWTHQEIKKNWSWVLQSLHSKPTFRQKNVKKLNKNKQLSFNENWINYDIEVWHLFKRKKSIKKATNIKKKTPNHWNKIRKKIFITSSKNIPVDWLVNKLINEKVKLKFFWIMDCYFIVIFLLLSSERKKTYLLFKYQRCVLKNTKENKKKKKITCKKSKLDLMSEAMTDCNDRRVSFSIFTPSCIHVSLWCSCSSATFWLSFIALYI